MSLCLAIFQVKQIVRPMQSKVTAARDRAPGDVAGNVTDQERRTEKKRELLDGGGSSRTLDIRNIVKRSSDNQQEKQSARTTQRVAPLVQEVSQSTGGTTQLVEQSRDMKEESDFEDDPDVPPLM